MELYRQELEVDKIPNVPHPRKNKKICGHNSAKNSFLKSLQSEKLHHAWLIHGPKGVGKATLAWKIVKLLQNGFSNFEKVEEENQSSLNIQEWVKIIKLLRFISFVQ